MTTTYNYEIFPILSNTQEWTNIILARKGGSHHHSTPSFSTNVVVAKTRFISNVRSFIILRSKEHVTSFTIKITVRTFLVNNGKMKFSGKSTLMRIREKTWSQFSYSQSSLSSNLKVSYVSLISTARKAFQPSYSMLLWG